MVMVSPRIRNIACSMQFSSSRTLPGQSYARSRARASVLRPSTDFSARAAKTSMKRWPRSEDVSPAFAKGRHIHARDVHPIVEVFSKSLLGNFDFEIAIGGRENAGIEGDRRAAPDRNDPPFLERSKYLGLELRRQIADLVEEERPAVRSDQKPRRSGLRLPRASPNNSASKQLRGSPVQLTDRSGPSASAAFAVDGACDQAFPGAGLSGDQDRRFAVCPPVRRARTRASWAGCTRCMPAEVSSS